MVEKNYVLKFPLFWLHDYENYPMYYLFYKHDQLNIL